MGPAAGADFERLFMSACAVHLRSSGIAVSGQAFAEHWLAQLSVLSCWRGGLSAYCSGPMKY